ncbi:MAG: Bor/Iss family lipoprotein [Salinibacter sp.]
MHLHVKHLLLTSVLIGFGLVFSGCLKTKIVTGEQPSNQTVELRWAHGFVAGLVPPTNAPLQVGEQCNEGVSEVYFRQTFVQLVAQGMTSSLYTPQRFTVTCAANGSMSSVRRPPSYLLKSADATPPSSSGPTGSGQTNKPSSSAK